MRLLHTSDWHVGKQIRGHSRIGEHVAVLEEIAQAAASNKVDLIAVAGDLFETAAPTAEAEKVVYNALMSLAETAPVIVVSGNHDNARRLSAIAPLMKLGNITVATEPASPKDGGVIEVQTLGGDARVAMLPFVSQRSILKAESLMSNLAFQNAQSYTHRLQQVLAALCGGFDDTAVNLVVAHAFVTGGTVGGGERAAHIADEYGVSALAFPVTTNYVALGHLHRAQRIEGQTAIHYCGSPLQLAFGEAAQSKQVNIVDLAPGVPAKVKGVALTQGRSLLTLKGNLEQVVATAKELDGSPWLRIDLEETNRPGLAEEVRQAIGEGVVDVRIQSPETKRVAKPKRRMDGKSHRELFETYLKEVDLDAAELVPAFDEILEEVSIDLDAAEAVKVSKTDAAGSTK